jgi:hypothetical protein
VQERVGSSFAQVSDSGDQNIAMVVAGAVSGSSSVFFAVKYILGLVVLSSYFLL